MATERWESAHGNPPPACTQNQGERDGASACAEIVGLRRVYGFGARCACVRHATRDSNCIQAALADADSPDWVELIPALKSEPRQIDLMDEAIQEILERGSGDPDGEITVKSVCNLWRRIPRLGVGRSSMASSICGTTQSNA